MTEAPTEFVDASATPAVRGTLHRPRDPSRGDALVLTHGAGGDRDAPLLVAIATELARSGVSVLRCDLPFRQARPLGPPGSGSGERDRAGLERAVHVVRSLVRGRVFLGGHSYGGRQSSMLAAEKPDLAAGLLLLSYPLHPPGRAEALRTAHLGGLRIPTLFVHGSRDPFGSLEELRAAMRVIPAPSSLLALDGASHALAKTKDVAGVARAVASAFLAFVDSITRRGLRPPSEISPRDSDCAGKSRRSKP
jgi:predicted alpha/beta-hydrolase family hydrolase